MNNFVFGLMVTGIGLGTIFGILGLLILVIYGFGFILNFKKKGVIKHSMVSDGSIDAKTVAAITACINCYYETEAEKVDKVEFVIKNIKRRKN